MPAILFITMEKKQYVEEIIGRLDREYPHAKIALKYSNPLELLAATILSAQSTDATVNRVTPKLFETYKTAADYAKADLDELEELIKSSGFYHNKARSIQAAARIIDEKYKGKVPRTMEELVSLPGVARKTANVVLYNAFGVEEGIAVDTHVKRLSGLLGLSESSNPDRIEQDLLRIVPRGWRGRFTYLLIEHGRNVCIANRPKCNSCVLSDICPSAFSPRAGYRGKAEGN